MATKQIFTLINTKNGYQPNRTDSRFQAGKPANSYLMIICSSSKLPLPMINGEPSRVV
jgi:hypothetical protein